MLQKTLPGHHEQQLNYNDNVVNTSISKQKAAVDSDGMHYM